MFYLLVVFAAELPELGVEWLQGFVGEFTTRKRTDCMDTVYIHFEDIKFDFWMNGFKVDEFYHN